METPCYFSNDFQNDFRDVYEPSEDTFLLLDAIEQDINQIKQEDYTICMEIGCGSGIVSTALAMHLKHTLFLATDINPKATEMIVRLMKQNHVKNPIAPVRTNLAECLNTRLKNQVDLLIFNPPYVPTEDEEVGHGDLSSAWAGGIDGRRVIDEFIKTVPNIIAVNGRIYLLLIEENRPAEIMSQLQNMGFDCKCTISRKCRNEKLCVIRCVKKE